MAKLSREKGKRGERELARKLTEILGVPCRRGQQYNGIDGQDVVGVEGLHIESKWVERLNLREAYAQAKRDADEDDVPVVCHKRNGEEWLVTVAIDDLPDFAYFVHFAFEANGLVKDLDE